MIELNKIFCEDCLIGMQRIPDGTVDAIICDLPYGTTNCSWDSVIPWDKLWEQYLRITKDDAAIVLFGSEPFSTMMRMSNLKMFRYDWIWDKGRGANFANANHQPMKSHEIASVFSKKQHRYYPQMWYSTPYKTNGGNRGNEIEMLAGSSSVSKVRATTDHSDGSRYPMSIIGCSRDGDTFHPTQKPVDLIRYLIRTYTNEGDTILDNCMGSGTTAIACIREKRNFIGFEMDEEYYRKACQRIENELRQPTLDFEY